MSDKKADSNEAHHVVFDRVIKSYAEQTITVRNLNLNINHGEFLTLLGPSGSGKTTTLMMLAGFERPTSGTIFLRGTEINNVPPHKRNIGVVFQHYALFPHMTVYENISYPLKIRQTSKEATKKAVLDALDMVSLSGLSDRYPKQLSGGQQQRVALARALVFEPELVLMDEPLGALDRQLREQLQIEIKHLHEDLGITMIYVTHDQAEALTMSDRIAVFDDGEIQQIGTPSDIYEKPINQFVAGFVGVNNIISGSVQQTNNESSSIILSNDTEIITNPVNKNLTTKKPITVSIRPEHISLLIQEEKYESTPDNNVISARVLELIYLGDHINIRLQAFGRDDIIAKIQPWTLPRPIHTGENVKIKFRKSDCHVMAAQES